MTNRFFRTLLLTFFLFFPSRSNYSKVEAHPSNPRWDGKIMHSCAPWDGPAFRVLLKESNEQAKDSPTIEIAIWKPPVFNETLSFNIPTSVQNSSGVASLSQFGSIQKLTGQIIFKKIKESETVEGNFNFMTEQGQHQQGTFRAVWQPSPGLFCG